ncbi:MAG: leucine--tRNA ligase [Candidatus Bathyarchaeota archaeon]|nr:leucine--tRNA ligase [Candidatus Bathyarchaeota archaeon]
MEWKQVDEKWQKRWSEAKIFEAEPDPGKKKIFATFPFPYMNGPLHVGHAFTATRVDVYARYMRMRGYNVLFPWAWHWTGETIAGASERIKKKDPDMLREFKEIDGVPDEEIEKFVDPAYVAKYYTLHNRKAAKRLGLSIDWRREFHTTSLDPTFNRFIEWQYKKLRELGYVFKGTHPVVWCPQCKSPTGDHDRLEGEGASPEDYILMKFSFGDSFLPAATFRPETIFGATNLWINPDVNYVRADVDGESWILSKEAVAKLREQLKKVEIIEEITGKSLIGKRCKEPLKGRELMILPGWFVDPNNGSGVVYSVPAHAPFDWIALRDLQEKPELLTKFGIKSEILDEIKPISMISIEGFGEFPAIEIVDQMKVKDQYDEKCEDATKTLYKKEFHAGILKPICGEFAGEKVYAIKDKLIEDFKEKKIIDSMQDLPENVTCRCTTQCIVKVLEGQWFLKYSDPDWKKRTHELLDSMDVYPEAARQWFHDVVDWYKDWACARRTGLGTPLPWSKDWIVETLSDSTVYMAFYTIRKHIMQHSIKPDQLKDEVFDYIYLGSGEPERIAKETGINQEVLSSMRDEFLYWYPVDMRNSAKELLPNHLTFFLFQHVALFDKELWPNSVSVNGMLMIEGKKMSKSKGNIVTVRDAIDNEGADVSRSALLFGAENMDDPDWRKEMLREIKERLRAFLKLVYEVLEMKEESEYSHLDNWLLSRIQNKVKKIDENMRELRTRTAIENALFEIWKDFRWYLRRAEKPNAAAIREFVDIWIRLLSPFVPHLSEEVWEKIGGKGFASLAEWPIMDEKKIDLLAEETESLIENVLEDTNDIIKVMKKSHSKIVYYASSSWKRKIFQEILNDEKLSIGDLMKSETVSKLRGKVDNKEIAGYIKKMSENVLRLPPDLKNKRQNIGLLNELDIIQDAKPFLKKELRCEIEIFAEDDVNKYDPNNRARLAQPYRPGIYIE